MLRKFPITLPLTSLALSALPGCGLLSDPLMGEWELTKIKVDGETVDLRQSGEISIEGYDCTYSYSSSLTVEFDEKEDGEFLGEWKSRASVQLSCDGLDDYNESSSYSGDVTAEKKDSGKYEIQVEPDGDDDDVELECEIDGDEMECEDEDGDYEYIFEKTD